jgi:hypothetical protein
LQKPRRLLARQLTAQRHHGEGVAHARPDKFIRFRFQNHLIKRVRIAVENAGHYPMGGLGRGTTHDRIDFICRPAQEGGKRSIG